MNNPDPSHGPNLFQQIVGEWAVQTFPNATLESIVAHLVEEAGELWEANRTNRGRDDMIREEAADCFLLLLHVAHRSGFSLFDAARVKFAINQTRRWEADDQGRGYLKHQEAGHGTN